VPHTFSLDGNIRFGDTIVLQHQASGYTLACDPYIDNFPGIGRFQVSSTTVTSPIARNVFKIVRPPSALKNFVDDESDPILRLGQAFCLAANDFLMVNQESNVLEPSLYLASMKKTERSSTKTTNRQMAYMTTILDADAIWVLMPPSRGKIGSSQRFLSIGSPASSQDSLLVIHRQTNTNLTADPAAADRTEFGLEIETFTDKSSAFGKISIVVSEFKGTCTPQTLSKADATKYYWTILTGTDELSATDDRVLPPSISLETLLINIRSLAKSKGPEGFSALRVPMTIIDKRSRVNDGKLDTEDIKECIIKWGFNIGEKYLDMLVSSQDKGDGLVRYREFIQFLRGSLSEDVMLVFDDIFSQLDTTGEGKVSTSDFLKFFKAEKHPLVISGTCSQQDVRTYLLDSVTFQGRTSQFISFANFIDFFGDIFLDSELPSESFRSIFNI